MQLRFTFIISISLVMFLFSCKRSADPLKPNDPTATNAQPEIFYGHITYRATITSSDSALAASLISYSPTQVDIYVDSSNFRLIETGGLSHGNILIFKKAKEVWQMDTAKKIAYLGEYSDFADPGSSLKNTMPDHYKPSISKTDKTATIAGFICDKYKIDRSGFIPEADLAYIWVAREIKFPSSRFDIQTEINRVAVPAPLYLGIEEGAILKLEVSGKNNTRIIEVISLNKNSFPSGIFEIPSDYQKK